MTRRTFVTRTAGGLRARRHAAGPVRSDALGPRQTQTRAATTDPKRPDPLAPAMVQDFVRKAHADLTAPRRCWPNSPRS